MPPGVSPRSALGNLLQALSGPGPVVILPHDNPDPDALASAATLKYILAGLSRREATIVLGGIVGRAENRAMLTYLNINLVPASEVAFGPGCQVVLVDTQPGRPNNSLPEWLTPTAVIDHHPPYGRYEGVPFLDLREQYGATATIFTEYLKESRLEVEGKIATALFYGIAAETQELGREARPADIAASQFLYPFTNKRRLAKIENARVPREYFQVFRDAIDQASLHGRLVVSVLGEVRYPDMVAEVADFLLRLDEVEWSAAIGFYDGDLYCSLRTTDREANAGDVLQRVLGSRSAGGHDMIAGGRVRLADGGAARAEQIRQRLLAVLGLESVPGRSLVP